MKDTYYGMRTVSTGIYKQLVIPTFHRSNYRAIIINATGTDSNIYLPLAKSVNTVENIFIIIFNKL